MEFFIPRPLIRWCFQFLLAALANRYNIGIVAYAMMPTHLHIIVNIGQDPNRPHDLPEFKKQLHANLAKIVNAYWGRSGHVMCADSVGDCIRIVDDVTELQQLSYVECNGVAAGMGRRPEDLKGAISQRRWLTVPQKIARPPFYFQERTWADEETLQLCVPKLFEQMGYDRESFQKVSQERLNRDLRRVRKRIKKSGKQVRTLKEIEEQTLVEKTEKSSADHSRAHLVGSDNAVKAEEFHRLESFLSWHDDALRRAKAGEEDVVFPPGTYKAAKKYGCRVADMEYYCSSVRRRDEGRLEEKYDAKVTNDHKRVIVLME
jgi:hypothetical protein